MNHQGLRWNVHRVANVGLRIRLNLYKRGFKIYDLLVLYCRVSLLGYFRPICVEHLMGNCCPIGLFNLLNTADVFIALGSSSKSIQKFSKWWSFFASLFL